MSDNKSSSIPNSYSLPPIVVPIFAPSNHDSLGINYSDRAEGTAKLQRDIEEINELSKKPGVSPNDIEQLKKNTGLNTFGITQRFSLFKQSKLWGQAAYELTRMPFENIVEELSDLTINEMEIIYKAGKTYVGVGENSQVLLIVKFILEFEGEQRTRQIDWITGNVSLKNRTIVMWNRIKFSRNELIVLPNPAHREKLFSSSSTEPAYYGIPFPRGTNEEPQYPNDKRELGELVWKELLKEGSCASINIWDGSIFTWGRGFAGKGGLLLELLLKLYQDAQIGELFRNVGIHVTDDKKLIILNAKDNSVLIGVKDDRVAWDYIAKNKSLLLFFISLCEMKYMPFVDGDSAKKQVRDKIINEQFNLIKAYQPLFQIDVAILAKWKTQLGEDDYKNFLSFIAHLYHWLPTFVNIKKTENNVLIRSDGSYIDGSIKELLFQFAKKAGKGKTMPWINMLEVNKNPATLLTVFNDLSKAKFGIEKFILDSGHFKAWGKGIANEKVFKLAVRFNRIDEVTNPNSPSWLLHPKFNDAAVYFNPDLKSGYIITR
jgi:hypothetical protein